MSEPAPDAPERLAVTSLGLWRLRRDLLQLFPAASIVHPALSGFNKCDGYIGWGNRPSGKKARQCAASKSRKCHLIEGGFLHGFFPGHTEPQASYILDQSGVHYDSSRPSDLENVIAAGIDDTKLLDRAGAAMKQLRSRKISKYNIAPEIPLQELGIDTKRGYVLLVDQVPHDASIVGAQANAETFRLMLDDAIRSWPDHQIVVRPHLASSSIGHLQVAAQSKSRVHILARACNVWPLLEQATHVYTVSSHCGFEALLCGTPVTCFGYPFYAGWGLTNDALPAECVPNRGKARSLETVFAAAYIKCSRYLDMHDRRPTTLENAIDALSVIVDSRRRNGSRVATAGLSPWKRRAVAPFLISRSGKPEHYSNVGDAQTAIRTNGDGVLAVWGETPIEQKEQDAGSRLFFRLEDGFLRSSGLGAALRFPLSLVRDSSDHLYYDSRGAGAIDAFLEQRPFSQSLLDRSSRLIDEIVRQRVTKYQLHGTESSNVAFSGSEDKRLKILITGQVEDDASILLSATGVKTNTELIERVRTLYPDAIIAYRDHPDVVNNLRSGKAKREFVDVDADTGSLPFWLDWCERVETMTSLTGFEALLRRKSVGVHGWPFYAGWGLTDDRLAGRMPRGRASLEELVAASMLLYPDYIHPESKLPCSVERVVEALANHSPPALLYRAMLHPLGGLIGRLKHRYGTKKT